MIYYFVTHPEEFDEVPETENRLEIIPNATTSLEGIQSWCHYLVCAEDYGRTDLEYNAAELSRRMIEKFKSSKCYTLKTPAEREKIIKYLNDHPDAKPKIPGQIFFY